MGARQLFRIKPRIMQQARETFTGGLKVIKEPGQRRLAACLDGDEREHEITDGFLLMPVCVWQNKADILAEASGKGVLSHRKPMLSRVTDS